MTFDAVADYLAGEARAGRIDPAADPRAAALLLLGACQASAFLTAFRGTGPPADALRRGRGARPRRRPGTAGALDVCASGPPGTP